MACAYLSFLQGNAYYYYITDSIFLVNLINIEWQDVLKASLYLLTPMCVDRWLNCCHLLNTILVILIGTLELLSRTLTHWSMISNSDYKLLSRLDVFCPTVLRYCIFPMPDFRLRISQPNLSIRQGPGLGQRWISKMVSHWQYTIRLVWAGGRGGGVEWERKWKMIVFKW